MLPRHAAGALKLLLVLAVPIVCSSCSKEPAKIAQSMNSPTGGTTPALDSTSTGKSVQITDKDHHIFLRPKVGTTQRYRVIDRREDSQEITDQLFNGTQGKKKSTNITEFYIRQSVRAVKPDSSVDMSYRIDSVQFSLVQDTTKINYASTRPQDRKDARFAEYNMFVGQEFGAIVSKLGEITEVYGLAPMLEQAMKDVPDSMKTEKYKAGAKNAIEMLLKQYVGLPLMHYPDKPLAKDSTWSIHAETNFPVLQFVQFPVAIDSKEVVAGFEDHGGVVLAVLEATSRQTPIQSTLEQGGTKATLDKFNSTATSKSQVDDSTGLVVRRVLKSNQSFVFTLETKQQAGKIARNSQSSTEETTIDLLE